LAVAASNVLAIGRRLASADVARVVARWRGWGRSHIDIRAVAASPGMPGTHTNFEIEFIEIRFQNPRY
jgi:hypothetical protein